MTNNIILAEKYNELYEISREAINHIDSGIAEKVLREIKKDFPILNLETIANDLEKKFYDLKIKMQIVNFMAITDKEAFNIFKNHLLVFFRIDIPIEERIACRYNYVGYSEKDFARIALKKAILENKERLGNLTIGEWVNRFEEKDIALERSSNSVMTFVLENQDIQKLPASEQRILKIILYVYKKLIALKLIDIFDVAETLKESDNTKSNNITNEIREQSFFNPVSFEDDLTKNNNVLKISFSDALRKYLEIGEQLITLNHIILKNFPEPVRPSIKNWIADYTYNAGYNRHTSLERGNYLFQNENAKKLGYSDKEKLSFILKAYDDNLPVKINSNTKQIIFPQKEIQKTAPAFEQKNNFPKTENNLRFTSPQKMSFENKNSAFQKPTFSSNTNFRNNTVPPTNVINLKK